MQRQRSLLPTARKRVKLSSGVVSVVPRLAYGHKLNTKQGQGDDQENMNVATLMQEKFQNEPNEQDCRTDKPHRG